MPALTKKPMRSRMSEKQLCNSIIEYLNYHGCYCWRTNAGMAKGEYKGKTWAIKIGKAGTSDIIGVYRDPISKQGIFIALEVKLPETRNRVTEAQKEFLKTIQDHGGIAAVVTSPEEALKVVEYL